MKLMLTVPIIVELLGKDEKKEELKIEVRDFSKAERKESQKLVKSFKDLSLRIEKRQKQLDSAEKRVKFYEKIENFEKALELQDKVDSTQEDLYELLKEVDKMGGDDFAETQSKKNFTSLVTGEGVPRLTEVAEEKGYEFVMNLVLKAKVEVEGKSLKK